MTFEQDVSIDFVDLSDVQKTNVSDKSVEEELEVLDARLTSINIVVCSDAIDVHDFWFYSF